MNKSITGIIPGIILIIFLVIIIGIVSSNTNKSSSNYSVLKDYMSADNIKNTLSIITECEIKNYNIERDESLDTLDGENTIGFRLKSDNYNVVMYVKNGIVNSIRYADNDLYRNNTVLKKITEVK
ncbi:MAG: hypothetical protein HFJ48_00885 [Clostridia bacterium]|nr:hypothetical protein [Clostridia bacterium]